MDRALYICTVSRAEVIPSVDGEVPDVNIYVESFANIFDSEREAEERAFQAAKDRWDLEDDELDDINVAVAKVELESLEQIVRILRSEPEDDSILDDSHLT
jgi:hypothetical protein